MRNPNCERIFTFNHVADCDIAQEKPKSKDQSDGGQQKKTRSRTTATENRDSNSRKWATIVCEFAYCVSVSL